MKTAAAILSGLALLALAVYSAVDRPQAPGALSFTYACRPGEFSVVAVSPSEIETGDAITIYGCGFQPGATVQIGGVQVASKSVSSDGKVLTATWPGPKVSFQAARGSP